MGCLGGLLGEGFAVRGQEVKKSLAAVLKIVLPATGLLNPRAAGWMVYTAACLSLD